MTVDTIDLDWAAQETKVSTKVAGAPKARPPRIAGAPIVGVLPRMRKDPIGFFVQTARDLGGMVELKLGPETGWLLTEPEAIKQVLQDNRLSYRRSVYLDVLKPVGGNGLFLAEGEAWKRQRQVSVKAFQGVRMRAMTEKIAATADEMIERWRVRQASGAAIDLVPETLRFTNDVFLRCMFSLQPTGAQSDFYDAVAAFMRDAERRFWALVKLPTWLPTAQNRRRRDAIDFLDRFIDKVLDDRRRATEEHDDLLAMLMRAYDEEMTPELSRAQLRDDALTLVIAGQDTTASALCWAWYALSKHPDIARRLKAEVDDVLQGRMPTYDDLARLKYTRMVFEEALRLYPAAWTFSRTALQDNEVGGQVIRKGEHVIIAPCAVHQRPELWPNPEGFDPTRFDPDRPVERHRFAYIPFGGGPRICLGGRFATMEAVTVLAMVAQRFRLDLVPGQTIEPEPMFIQRPRYGLKMRVEDA